MKRGSWRDFKQFNGTSLLGTKNNLAKAIQSVISRALTGGMQL